MWGKNEILFQSSELNSRQKCKCGTPYQVAHPIADIYKDGPNKEVPPWAFLFTLPAGRIYYILNIQVTEAFLLQTPGVQT